MKLSRIIAPLVAGLLVAGACAAPRSGAAPTATAATGGATSTAAPDFSGKTLNVVTGGTGGVYIVYGAGLAELLNKKLRTAASAQSTAASVANMQLIRDGKADLAFTLADTAYDAVQGRGAQFTDKKVDAKNLAVLYTNFTHIVAKDGAGINTVADLKGKRVSVGAAASGTEIIANRVLEANGIDPAKDITRERLGVADSANALRDGKVDAFFWSGGLPTAQIIDLTNSTKVKFISHQDSTKKMADKYGPFYFDVKIPKGTYKNDEDVTVSGVANILAVPASMDPALARAILTTMFDNKSELETIHAEAKNLKLETAVEGSPIDYHPGAIEFYRSKGVWKK
ncbi:MAG TPA: TAXI family TRAP transporter solute-binding subunit [Candidatus Limnocylindria bacterium]|nr:TAXI family TRAP transporter solute-binding subunit [Candidatus Limnocylindria bacterium]